jgi:hypothetical protein
VRGVQQIRQDLQQALAKPRTRYRNILSLPDLNQTVGVGI